MYHISSNHNLSHLTPKIPKHRMPSEDSITPRICFAETIFGAAEAIDTLENFPYAVYQPAKNSRPHIYEPTEKDVPDVEITTELWVLNEIEVELVGYIQISDWGVYDGKKVFRWLEYNEDGVIFVSDDLPFEQFERDWRDLLVCT